MKKGEFNDADTDISFKSRLVGMGLCYCYEWFVATVTPQYVGQRQSATELVAFSAFTISLVTSYRSQSDV